jgi:hypothetical protein
MKETGRRHARLARTETPGPRQTHELGSLLLPSKQPPGRTDLLVHFHGAPWLVEQAARRALPRATVLAVQIGSGSGVYSRRLAGGAVLKELWQRPWRRRYVSAFSAGYGAVRELLKAPEFAESIDALVLADSLHAGHESMEQDLAPFLALARRAAAGQTRFLLLHSEVFPGTYASTTETADWLLEQLNLKRRPVLRWGPLGTQQVSEAKTGKFEARGFAGNSAPDHMDFLHALETWLRAVR